MQNFNRSYLSLRSFETAGLREPDDQVGPGLEQQFFSDRTEHENF